MNRILAMLLGACLVMPFSVSAQNFEEGLHYELITPEPPQGKAGEKIEVVEFFMYGCPHCYHFEPAVKEWLKNKADDIEFVRVPAMFGRHFNMHAQVYYALEAMGELERVHEAFFAEIHDRNNRLKNLEAVKGFLKDQGVDLAKFDKAMDSFAVAAKTNRANTLLRRYGIRSVPSLVIDQRFKSGRGLDFKGMTQLADALAEQTRQARAGSTK